MLSLKDIHVGQVLPVLKKNIVQNDINLYAGAARDFNPIHLDAEFASKTPSQGIIAHGMLVLAYVSQMMTEAFGVNWLSQGKLDVRFKMPARPGDTLTVKGKISKVQVQGINTLIQCEVVCSNQKGELIITGEAAVSVILPVDS